MLKLLKFIGHIFAVVFLMTLAALVIYFLSFQTLCNVNYINAPYTGDDPIAHAHFIQNTFMQCEGVPSMGWVPISLMVIVWVLILRSYIKYIKSFKKQK